ncbi:MAG TPA: bifunctional ADP-dependent NAD(P)H-hydrate dehydratase/NAD(P)H-hydrate epimerase [Clostridiaceae bacterium]|jgi:NAD(P)H-hydrate epimerase|nr:bifunctional ADP-dependent NAD(P)H-hydrate dehydratase/NAD(P)H-hydrate epimerase [Clostridiaceae bacterium]HBF78153.1 bifunctional ADP-dependent NAD(P)H-hydrate dehydratase/NAD(P)H-hydrate epimerase [Clostridiaceae bacterium]HBG38030.1 bifunctional ADP-dependent NAD(P)H-hydrate dehydratase/NAD(P)H-hydrate epimerase [Clostridiaceae bacterium]HBN29128.1 bifunctional ADP-dependent NAD(P)H-hydrate dehydratase/NAD(P)H-hydrate epimerase [Clostridiaceae bacterium]HBX47771.1 bifunctional ADP-depende
MFAGLSQDMREIDKRAETQYGISSIVLMENAAYSVLKHIKSLNRKSVMVVCGTGNNGGDGFALSRLLIMEGYKISIFCFGDRSKIKGDAYINYQILLNMDVKIEDDLQKLNNIIEYQDIVVDALLGTGIKGEVRDYYKEVIKTINESKAYIISVDIPSGINADTGEKMGECVYADETITFGCIKLGEVLLEGRKACGNLIVENISIPDKCIEEQNIRCTTSYKDYPLNLLRKREVHTNKGDYGKVYIIGGSYLMSGAVILCAKGALNSGCGLTTCVIPDSILNRVGSGVFESTFITYDENLGLNKDVMDNIIEKADAIVFGIGMGRNKNVEEALTYFLENFEKPIVIDADGINALSNIKSVLKNSKAKVIITPHPKEMERLTGLEVSYINKNRKAVAENFAKEYGCTVLLKGASTVVSDGENVYVNTSGNPGMASGGSGDVLTGVLASFAGQGYSPYEASILAAYIHGAAGDSAYEDFGYGLHAENIANYLGKNIR